MKKILISTLAIVMILGIFVSVSANTVPEPYYVCRFNNPKHTFIPGMSVSDLIQMDNIEIQWFSESDIIFMPYSDLDSLLSDFDENHMEIHWFDESEIVFISYEDLSIVHYDDPYVPVEPYNITCTLLGCNPVGDGRFMTVPQGGPNANYCTWGIITEGAICSRCDRFMGTRAVASWTTPHQWQFIVNRTQCRNCGFIQGGWMRETDQ